LIPFIKGKEDSKIAKQLENNLFGRVSTMLWFWEPHSAERPHPLAFRSTARGGAHLSCNSPALNATESNCTSNAWMEEISITPVEAGLPFSQSGKKSLREELE